MTYSLLISFLRKSMYLIILLFISILVNSCGYLSPEVVQYDGIELIEIKENTAEINLNATIENKNIFKYKLNNAQFKVYINSIFLGNGVLVEPVDLPKYGRYPIRLHLAIEFEKTIPEIAISLGLAVLTNNLTMRISGKMTGSIAFLEKTFPVTYAQKISWEEINSLMN